VTATVPTPTLYQDWQARKDRLAALPQRTGGFRETELRLLNFLLQRFRGAAEVDVPARFPIRGEVYVDRRAIVVHAHLGKGYLSDVHTRREAEQRVRGLVERMASPATSDEASAAGPLFNPAAPPFDEALEAIRGRLCDANADVRLVAIVELGGCGNLDDIGLISDLLALPPQRDEDPFERHVLLTAMKKIVRRVGKQPRRNVRED